MENVFVRISLVSRKINRKNVFGKNHAITVLKMQFAKTENVPASGAIQEKTSNHFIGGIRVVVKGSWKKREVRKSEVGKFLFKLERAKRSWKEPSEVGKFR